MSINNIFELEIFRPLQELFKFIYQYKIILTDDTLHKFCNEISSDNEVYKQYLESFAKNLTRYDIDLGCLKLKKKITEFFKISRKEFIESDCFIKDNDTFEYKPNLENYKCYNYFRIYCRYI